MAKLTLPSCCWRFSLRTGSLIIALTGLIGSTVYGIIVAFAIFSLPDPDCEGEECLTIDMPSTAPYIVALLTFASWIMGSAILLAGTLKENSRMVMIWLVIYSISIPIIVLFGAVAEYCVGNVECGVQEMIYIGIIVYEWVIVYSHYKELKEKTQQEIERSYEALSR